MGLFDAVTDAIGARGHTIPPAGVWSVAGASQMNFDAIKKPSESELSTAWRQAIAHYDLQKNSPDEPVIDDSLVPRETKESKDAYAAIRRRKIEGARIYGNPGSGLSASGFGKDQIRSGSRGEEIFAKLLSWDHILDYCSSYWSVWNPEQDGEKNSYGTDIDCILKFGNHILLIDVKNYRSGVDYHTLIPGKAMFCMYAKARVVAHDPYIFSSNMAFAYLNLTQYLRRCGSSCDVESYVVLVPSTTGQATLDADICWPGGIRAMSYTNFVTMLNERAQKDPSYTQFDAQKTREELYLASLVKSYDTPLLKPDEPLPVESSWPIPVYDKLAGIKPKPKYKPKSKAAKPYRRNGGKPASTASSPTSSSSQTATKRWNSKADRTLERIPTLNLNDLSFDGLKNDDGVMEPIRWGGVSGAVMAGERGSGSVMCINSVLGTLIADGGVDVRIVDCTRTSTMEMFEDHVFSYVKSTDGLDLVSGEIQEVYTALKPRARKLKQQHTDDFWADSQHGGLRPQILYIHECAKLFASETIHDESDEQSMNDIRRYLLRILEQGGKLGITVLFSTQKPSLQSLPKELVAYCGWRACFHVASQQAAQAVMEGVDTGGLKAWEIMLRQIGRAVLVRPDQEATMMQFLTIASSALEKRFPK